MRTTRARVLSALLSLPFLIGVAACSDDGPQNRDEAVDLLTREFMSDSDFGMDRDDAECLASKIVDEIGFERLDAAIRDSDGDLDSLDADMQFELGMAALAGMGECLDEDFLLGD